MLRNNADKKAIVIWLLAMILCFMIWPYGILHKTKVIQTGVEYNHLTEPLSGGVYAVQDFTASEKKLRSIVLMLDKNSMQSEEGILQVELRNMEDVVLQVVQVPISEIHSYQDCEVMLQADVIRGERYRYAVEALNTQGEGPKLVYRSKARAGVEELGMLSYFGVAELPDAVSMTRLVYQIPLTWYQILAYDAFLLFIAAVMTGKENIVFRK